MPGMVPSQLNGGPPPSSFGYYSGSPVKANGLAFTMKKRMERIDWRKVAAIDIDRMSRELDYTSLQENIMNITFCNIEAEIDTRSMDPNFLKLFKLAQLTIEYLLHSQEYLQGRTAGVHEKMRQLSQEQEETEKAMEKLKQELADVKKESHKRKKLLAAQQQILHSGANSYNKCPYCQKAFINPSFLQAHMTRRHSEYMSSQTPSPINLHVGGNPSLEKELQEFKERLRQTESQLLEERNRWNQLSQMAPSERKAWEENKSKEVESWKNSQLVEQKKEIEQVREMFMKEFNELNAKFQASEHQLNEIQGRYGPRSNLGELKDDVDDDALVKQREEVAMLKELLANRLANVETSINSQVKTEINNMQKQQANELNRLRDQLKDRQMSSGEKPQFDERIEELLMESSRESERLLQSAPMDMLDGGDEVVSFQVATLSKRQEEKLQEQNEKIEKMVAIPAASAPSPPRKRTSSPRHEPPSKKQKEVARLREVPKMNVEAPSSAEEEESELEVKEEMVQWTNQALDMEGMYGHSTLDSSGLRTGELGTSEDLVGTMVRSSRLQAHLRNNPSVLKGMKEELLQLLIEQLEDRGIPADTTGISNVVLNNKLDLLQKERQQIAKKNKNFWDIRRQFEKKVDKMAWERYIDSRGSPKGKSKKHSSLSVSPRASPNVGRRSPLMSKKSPQAPRKNPVASKKSPNVARRSPSPPKPAPRTSTTLSTSASSTMRSEEDWDTEEEEETEEDEDYTEDSAAPSARDVKTAVNVVMSTPKQPSPRREQNLPKNIEHDESEWDSEISELSNIIPSGDNNLRERPASVPTPVKKGPNVERLSQSIELQLTGRGGKKPVGGVNTLGSTGKFSPNPNNRQHGQHHDNDDDDDSSSISISSLQDLNQPKPAPRKAAVRGSGETDFSTNTYGTSVWGSSKANNPAAKSSVSVTDWDSDLEIDDL
ncbi:cilium assembly protein DZIP1L-like isoform X3 [Lineus longissimus]|uniref:cilium assembly protein DZIP1L-like isoform X3 n=1 Tax=Lineus longissimus TaxID=88925 RepID=UPI002B4DDA51